MNGRPIMTQQVLCRLMTMQAFSTSKHKDRAANGGTIPEDRIYSKSTFDSYLDIGVHFAKYAEENYGCLWLDDTRPYVSNYLTQRMLDGISPWTLHRDASALAKLFRCTSADFGVKLPPRRRGDVSRYQNTKEEIAQFEKDYPLLAQALKECGLRRHELRLLLSVGDVRVDEKGNVRVMVRQGKGGPNGTFTPLATQCSVWTSRLRPKAANTFAARFRPTPQFTHFVGSLRKIHTPSLRARCTKSPRKTAMSAGVI